MKDYSEQYHNVHKRWGFLKKWGFLDDSTGFHMRKPYLGKAEFGCIQSNKIIFQGSEFIGK